MSLVFHPQGGPARAFTTASPHAKYGSWVVMCLVLMSVAMAALLTRASKQKSPAADPPPTENLVLVGLWASVVFVDGAIHEWLYTFNRDGSFAQVDTNPAGQSASVNANYAFADDFVTISYDNRILELGSVMWIGPDQFQYRITSDARRSLDPVFTRQTASPGYPPPRATTTDGNPAPLTPIGLTGDAITKAYQDSQAGGDPGYDGQIISFVGKVTADTPFMFEHHKIVDRDGMARYGTALILATEGHPPVSMGTKYFFRDEIWCVFPDETRSHLNSLRRGDSVAVRGLCAGRMGARVEFYDCSIVNGS